MQEFGEATAHKDTSKEESKKENPKCQICGKVFVYNYHLNVHLKTVHGKQKPFPCGACTALPHLDLQEISINMFRSFTQA